MNVHAFFLCVESIFLDYVDSITIHNLLLTDLCDWNAIFSKKTLLSKYLNNDEIKFRVKEFNNKQNRNNLVYSGKSIRIKACYVLNFDIENASKYLSTKLLLSYYIWRKLYLKHIDNYKTSSDELFTRQFNDRDDDIAHDIHKEYMKINYTFIQNWYSKQYNNDTEHIDELMEINTDFKTYNDSKVEFLNGIDHHIYHIVRSDYHDDKCLRYNEIVMMHASNSDDFKLCNSASLIIDGFIREVQSKLISDIIPSDINGICMKYYFDENLYFQNNIKTSTATPFKVKLVEPQCYSIRSEHQCITDALKNTAILPELIGKIADKWYCGRCMISGYRYGLFGYTFVQKLMTFLFAELPSSNNNESTHIKRRFVVYCLTTKEEQYEDSSSDDESDSSD